MSLFSASLALSEPSTFFAIPEHPVTLNPRGWCTLLTFSWEFLELAIPEKMCPFLAITETARQAKACLLFEGWYDVDQAHGHLVARASQAYPPMGILVLYHRVWKQLSIIHDSRIEVFDTNQVAYPKDFLDAKRHAAFMFYKNMRPKAQIKEERPTSHDPNDPGGASNLDLGGSIGKGIPPAEVTNHLPIPPQPFITRPPPRVTNLARQHY